MKYCNSLTYFSRFKTREVKVGDVITAIDGISTPTMSEFLPLLWSYNVGNTITVTYISEKSPFITEITLDERP